VWAPDGSLPSSCSVPPLPYGRTDHTVDVVVSRRCGGQQEEVILCGGDGRLSDSISKSCLKLAGSKWTELTNTYMHRVLHSSMVVGESILLIGGLYSGTAELVPTNGSASQLSFYLESGQGHCGITVAEDIYVITGGESTLTMVTEITGITRCTWDCTDTIHQLSPLNTGRYRHACGSYEKAGKMVLIVAGGRSATDLISSTEVLDYSQGDKASWRFAGPLPSARVGLQGATVAGIFYTAGGLDNTGRLTDILKWKSNTETWGAAGHMAVGREFHTFTAVNLSSVCTAP